MLDPQKLFEEMKAEYGEENSDRIMDSIVTNTMALIEFLAKSAGVSFEIMCSALILADKQTKEEH